MREQYCRDHIDAVAKGCGIDPRVVSDIKDATDFEIYARELIKAGKIRLVKK